MRCEAMALFFSAVLLDRYAPNSQDHECSLDATAEIYRERERERARERERDKGSITDPWDGVKAYRVQVWVWR